jgi:uridine kinase
MQTSEMPAGLDGNPDPIVASARTVVLEQVADRVGEHHGDRVLVGIDGRSGTGKSTFGDELARALERRGRVVIRSTTDLFHRPRAERMRLGASSPDGHYQDSHQVPAIVSRLLVPFRSGASEVLVGAFDEPTDQPRLLQASVPTSAVLVFDGLFVHRPELLEHWDLTVMLRADRRCDEAWLRFLESDLPLDPIDRAGELDRRLKLAKWPRYRQGWSRYLDAIEPTRATVDIDNEDLAFPIITAG